MTLALPQGGNAALAQTDPTARTLLIGLNWDWPAATPPVKRSEWWWVRCAGAIPTVWPAFAAIRTNCCRVVTWCRGWLLH